MQRNPQYRRVAIGRSPLSTGVVAGAGGGEPMSAATEQVK